MDLKDFDRLRAQGTEERMRITFYTNEEGIRMRRVTCNVPIVHGTPPNSHVTWEESTFESVATPFKPKKKRGRK